MRIAILFIVAPVLLLLTALAAKAEPYPLRIGDGFAVEEQVWLMKALPRVTPNQGKVYNLELIPFRGADMRFAAFAAGQIEIATGSAQAIMQAASHGADLRIIASVSREQEPGFVTQYMSLATMPFNGLQDLKGKIIGTNATNSSIVAWAEAVAAKAGLDPNRDIRFAVVPFPSEGEAVRSGKLDIGALPQPFAANEIAAGGLKTVFTSKTGVPFAEELNDLITSPAFLEKHGDVVRAYLSDFVAATHYYVDHLHEARQALIDAKAVAVAPNLYVNMADNYRERDARIDMNALAQDQDLFVKLGFQKEKVDLSKLVDMSYLPK
jgi:ABC-type nitrate/sulfonate/bicarbonate transport system substrate-binding protein